MEEVKGTLWTWAVQICALAGLAWELWGIGQFAQKLGERTGEMAIPSESIVMLAAAMVVGALVFYVRLLKMRRWAGWLKMVGSGAHVYHAATASESGLSHWGAQLALATAIVLACALVFKPKLWHDKL